MKPLGARGRTLGRGALPAFVLKGHGAHHQAGRLRPAERVGFGRGRRRGGRRRGQVDGVGSAPCMLREEHGDQGGAL